jgi:hypothetical protein
VHVTACKYASVHWPEICLRKRVTQQEPMRGVITTRHLVTHAPLIMRLFGIRAYFKCVACVLRKGGRATFLDAVSH